MPTLRRLQVALRRLLARRPWIHWLAVVAAAVATGAVLRERVGAVDEARRAWGESRGVLVARQDAHAGELLAVELRELPAAVVPPGALEHPLGAAPLVARQDVAAGEVVTGKDVGRAGHDGPAALLPDGWVAVPIVESPAAGATIGSRVQITGDGVVLAAEAIVVGYRDDVTLVAVPAEAAPMVAAGARSGGVTVLLLP